MEEQKEIDPNSYFHISNSSPWLEIRLFYVRITPCVTDTVPDHLTLRHLRRKLTTPLEINGSRIPSSDSASVTLRRDRINKESSEVTYVSTDSVRVTGAVEFEVLEGNDMILCGSLERVESAWGNGSVGLESDANGTGWSVECYVAACVLEGRSSFFKASCIEVYIAGCCGGVPVILTKTISISPRRKGTRQGMLDSIPEDEELEKDGNFGFGNGLVCRGKSLTSDSDSEVYELDEKLGNRYYLENRYYDEDGQLSWFNAGVRVGVGISLGVCVGVGLGVGLLMHSYQTATRNFRRRFF